MINVDGQAWYKQLTEMFNLRSFFSFSFTNLLFGLAASGLASTKFGKLEMLFYFNRTTLKVLFAPHIHKYHSHY